MVLIRRKWFDRECCELRTFLHVSAIGEEASSFERQVSDPTFYRGNLMMGLPVAGKLQTEHGQRFVAPCWLRTVMPEHEEPSSPTEAAMFDTPVFREYQQGSDQEMPPGTASTSPKLCTRGRPCKAQRARYRKLADSLIQLIKEDPFGVDICALQSEFPRWVTANTW
eukprot:CAMPEP_0172725572 /NCGR_PEP_ID=MMETSP1074-20121228/88709_1 /TAXON_ID=2916 /ORGANISM="Ceratium fusus, Strain PA161109" /LENGTH=166 /DNA_ID=CAMNT_0013552379 /DNA_START=49 /DNA_END=546 /DNA_ORIENTATION=-